jgi:S1-C subfamily serine protease
MKRLLALLSVMVLVGCSTLGGAVNSVVPRSKLSIPELVSIEGASTVALMSYRDDKDTTQTTGFRPFCTGVWVDETHIMTADHCAKAEQRWQQKRLDKRKEDSQNQGEPKSLQEMLERLFGGRQGNTETDTIEEKGLSVHYIVESEVVEVGKEPAGWHLSKVVAYDESHDLALLEVVGHATPGHKVAKLAAVTPGLGESVHIVGQTVGMYWTYIHGSVAAYRGADMLKGKDDKGPWMQVASPMYYGNSGGGAFNDYGELVGIADWIKDAPEMGFFVHLDTLRSFLDKNLPAKK